MSHSGEVSTITIMDFGEGAGKNHSLDRFSKSLGNLLEKSSRQHLLQCRLTQGPAWPPLNYNLGHLLLGDHQHALNLLQPHFLIHEDPTELIAGLPQGLIQGPRAQEVIRSVN